VKRRKKKEGGRRKRRKRRSKKKLSPQELDLGSATAHHPSNCRLHAGDGWICAVRPPSRSTPAGEVATAGSTWARSDPDLESQDPDEGGRQGEGKKQRKGRAEAAMGGARSPATRELNSRLVVVGRREEEGRKTRQHQLCSATAGRGGSGRRAG
jgi:hypothetical protein